MAMDMIFGEGPILTGNWYNPKTGDSFTVRDTYFEDNNFYVLTTDGRRMDYNLMSQYVQSDKPIPKMEQPKPQAQIPQEVLSQMVESGGADDFMTDEDRALIMGSPVQPQQTVQPTVQPTIHPNFSGTVTQGQGESEDDMLVRRILKRSTTPDIDCKVSWRNFPTKQMEMLNMMAVDVDAIVDYYIKDIDLEQIREIVKEAVRKHIEKSLCVEEQTEEKPAKEQTTSKPNNNKTKEKKKK
jgi:hypothetical protein